MQIWEKVGSTLCCEHFEGKCKSEGMMKGKKEGQGLRGGRDYRIVYAVAIGLFLGAFWAYLRPHGFFGPEVSSSHALPHVRGTAIGSSTNQIGVRKIIKTH